MAKISDKLTTEPKVQSTSLLTYALAAMLRKLPRRLLSSDLKVGSWESGMGNTTFIHGCEFFYRDCLLALVKE